MAQIHPTAIVSPKAQLGEGVVVHPYSIIEDDVQIGDGSEIGPQACIYNGARLGKNVKIMQSSSISNVPQDLKYKGEETYLYIGDNTIIRECVTCNKGTVATGKTVIGKNCLIMAFAHVAHDCVLGDNIIIANSVQLAGHVTIGDYVFLGGGALIPQFVTLGKHSMVAAGVLANTDVPPFIIVSDRPSTYKGINTVGLKRRGFSSDEMQAIKKAYAIVFGRKQTLADSIEKIKSEIPIDDNIFSVISFLENIKKGLPKS